MESRFRTCLCRVASAEMEIPSMCVGFMFLHIEKKKTAIQNKLFFVDFCVALDNSTAYGMRGNGCPAFT